MKVRFNIKITGLVIALILVGMFAATFSTFLIEMEDEYNVTGNNTFAKYNSTQFIKDDVQKIRNATKTTGDPSIIDVIGGFFRAGYSALTITWTSFDFFENLMNYASGDIVFFAFFSKYIRAIFLIAIAIGVMIVVLVKMSV